MDKILTGSFSLERVSVWGLIMLALAVVLSALSGSISKKFDESKQGKIAIILKLAALVLGLAGAFVAIYAK